MKNLKYFSLFAALFSTVLFAHMGMAQDNRDGDWQVLFNGQDLTGWELLNGQHEVEVRDGMIVATAIAGLPNGFLATKEKYDDFILELEVKADLQLHNSGIQFRSLSTDEYQDGRVHGYQAEVDITPQRWSGAIYDEARRGWLYILEDEDSPAKHAFKNNRWNYYRIEAFGNTNRVWVNGIPTSHLVDDMTTRGFIALQIHGNSRPQMPQTDHNIYFRNIRIKTKNIEPSPYDDIFVMNLIPNTVSGQEEYQGFSLLWNGRNLDGWRGVDRSEAPDQGWQIKDGILMIDSKEAGFILTEEQFGPFELKFEFMQHEENGKAGISYLVSEPAQTGSPSTSGTYGQLTARQTKGAGEWNKGTIKVLSDGVVQYWLNGYEMLEYHLDPEKSIKGHIRLEGTDSPISYRSIKLRSLD